MPVKRVGRGSSCPSPGSIARFLMGGPWPERQRHQAVGARPQLFVQAKSGRGRAALSSAAFIFLAVLFVGCVGTDRFGGSRQAAVAWAHERGFTGGPLELGPFRLLALHRLDAGRDLGTLRVYIEGDGAAWPGPYRPPRDPTPVEPVALALAAADPSPQVAYLGRPCQYLDAAELAACAPAYWTGSRFAPEVVHAYMQSLDRLKSATGARRLRLVGYSGGGVLAALLASRRNDIEQLVTVASPLAVAEWTAWHKISPLRESLDPATTQGVRWPPAIHFAGADDDVVPPPLIAGFAARSGGIFRAVDGFDHQCCWSRDWRRLLEEAK